WTIDVRRAMRVATKLRAGTVWVNAYRVVGPNMPFGGYKTSGIGRENGADVLHEYTETKSVWIETSGATRSPFTRGCRPSPPPTRSGGGARRRRPVRRRRVDQRLEPPSRAG